MTCYYVKQLVVSGITYQYSYDLVKVDTVSGNEVTLRAYPAEIQNDLTVGDQVMFDIGQTEPPCDPLQCNVLLPITKVFSNFKFQV